MARVLMVGIDPDLVDFADPSLPPGMNADIIRRGIEASVVALGAAGDEAIPFLIRPDLAEARRLADHLAAGPVDCVTIGGGVHRPPQNLVLLEALINAVIRAPSRPAIALIARPDEAPAAVARALRR